MFIFSRRISAEMKLTFVAAFILALLPIANSDNDGEKPAYDSIIIRNDPVGVENVDTNSQIGPNPYEEKRIGGGPPFSNEGENAGNIAKGLTIREQLRAVGATKFLALLETSGLKKILDGEGVYTVFAPTNEAMEKLEKSNGCQQRNPYNDYKKPYGSFAPQQQYGGPNYEGSGGDNQGNKPYSQMNPNYNNQPNSGPNYDTKQPNYPNEGKDNYGGPGDNNYGSKQHSQSSGPNYGNQPNYGQTYDGNQPNYGQTYDKKPNAYPNEDESHGQGPNYNNRPNYPNSPNRGTHHMIQPDRPNYDKRPNYQTNPNPNSNAEGNRGQGSKPNYPNEGEGNYGTGPRPNYPGQSSVGNYGNRPNQPPNKFQNSGSREENYGGEYAGNQDQTGGYETGADDNTEENKPNSDKQNSGSKIVFPIGDNYGDTKPNPDNEGTGQTYDNKPEYGSVSKDNANNDDEGFDVRKIYTNPNKDSYGNDNPGNQNPSGYEGMSNPAGSNYGNRPNYEARYKRSAPDVRKYGGYNVPQQQGPVEKPINMDRKESNPKQYGGPPPRNFNVKASLLHNILLGSTSIGQLRNLSDAFLPALSGIPVSIHIIGDDVYVNGGKIIRSESQSEHGAVHLVDSVYCLHRESLIGLLYRDFDIAHKRFLNILSVIHFRPFLEIGPPVTVVLPSNNEMNAFLYSVQGKNPTFMIPKVLGFVRTHIFMGHIYPSVFRSVTEVRSFDGTYIPVTRNSENSIKIGDVAVNLNEIRVTRNGVVYPPDVAPRYYDRSRHRRSSEPLAPYAVHPRFPDVLFNNFISSLENFFENFRLPDVPTPANYEEGAWPFESQKDVDNIYPQFTEYHTRCINGICKSYVYNAPSGYY